MGIALETPQLEARINWRGTVLSVDLLAGRSIAMSLDPHGSQPVFFSTEKMRAEPLNTGSFVGDVRLGGSCNCELLHWAPHCHGTHTECIGHISAERRTVLECIDTCPGLARLLTVRADKGIIRVSELQNGLDWGGYSALILRTLPNVPEKQWRDYSRQPEFPTLAGEAVRWLCQHKLRHLLLDTPSMDRPDNSRLENHRIWWGDESNVQVHGFPPHKRSVTEMIYVDDAIPDGDYWLNIELASVVSDAVPSRPVIYPVAAASR